MTYCSTDLSATSPPSYRQLINRFSTTCPPACQPVVHIHCEDRRRRGNPGLISVSRLDGERQRSVDSGVGTSKTPGCSRWVQGEGQNPRATARLQFFSRERESVNRLTGMIGHFHLQPGSILPSILRMISPHDMEA